MTFKIIFKPVFVACLLVVATTAKAGNELLKDMVHFDQAYIPLLALTSVEDKNGSKASMNMLLPAWDTFKNKYYSQHGNDQQWQKDFDKVDGYIKASQKIVSGGMNIKAAHEELEHVRVIFMHLRERNAIDYFIDHLTRFHEPMEHIVLAVKGKNETTLTDRAITEVKDTLPEAKKLWHEVSNAKFDAATYEFNANKVAMLKELIKKEKAALQNLEKALMAENKKQIIQAGMAIKPNFARLFKLFGHFPG